jgi:3-dehydroquinate synthetase
VLNLGHTFAHALEAAAGYTLAHGDAVALGLLAALRLSGNDDALRTVERELAPKPVQVDRERAWEALHRDKKAASGRVRLVLLPRNGEPEWGVELPDAEVRRELDRLVV